jgi:hypothetical protein
MIRVTAKRLLARLLAWRRPAPPPIVRGRMGGLTWRSLTPDECADEDLARRQRIEELAAARRARTPWLRRGRAERRPWLHGGD